MHFAFFRNRYVFEAAATAAFAEGAASNVFRGAFGWALRKLACVEDCPGAADCSRRETCPYALGFEPKQAPGRGPSGFADPPRPFVLRAGHLNGKSFEPGQRFAIDAHRFSALAAPGDLFQQAFAHCLPERARLVAAFTLDLESNALPPDTPIVLPLAPLNAPLQRVSVRFVSPTELKAAGKVARTPEFPVLFARVCDRLRTLASRYAAPIEMDFAGMAQRAARIELVSHALTWERVERRSRKTGQTHPLGGFRGEATYEGDLREFAPLLEAAQWCGVGRQTVWGKGAIEVRY
jgi:hypothetical protein